MPNAFALGMVQLNNKRDPLSLWATAAAMILRAPQPELEACETEFYKRIPPGQHT